MVIGAQEPRVLWVPEYESSLGQEAVELAKSAGLEPDPWQEFVIQRALGQRDGKWAAFEIGVDVPRQNGKGGILEIRELVGLFLIRDPLTIHSAHQFDTSLEAFRRLLALIEDTPELDKQVKRVVRSHGEEGIEVKGGSRIRFRTRTKGGGRGFSCDCLILDEAMFIPEFTHGALLPTLSGRSLTAPNGVQVWYTGSAVDQVIHEDGVVFARVRERGHRGGEQALAYFEWSVDEDALPDNVEPQALTDCGAWAQANPGLGIRIAAEHIEHELRSMDSRGFAVERLGIGDWPPTDRGSQSDIDIEQWQGLVDAKSKPLDPVCFAFDVSPNRSSAAIGVSGYRDDELAHVEVIDHRKGTGWLVDRIAKLVEKHEPAAVVCDKRGPAASLVDILTEKGVEVRMLEAPEYVHACGTLFDLVEQEGLRHLGTSELKMAIQGAKQRPLGDAWAWARSKSAVDITPLVAVTLALWGTMREQPAAPLVAFA